MKHAEGWIRTAGESVVCTKCGKRGIRILSGTRKKHRGNGYCTIKVYKDQNGGTWDCRTCHSCRLRSKVLLGRKNGLVHRDEVVDPANKKGRDAERRAAAHFRDLGYEVELTNGTGPDLVIKKLGEVKTVEVKSVTNTVGRWCFVGPVSENRKQDDLIVFVFDDGKIVVQPMQEHLSNSTKSGFRSITRLRYSDSEIKYIRPPRKNTTSGVTGVSFNKRENKWRAYISINGKQKSLGYHATKEQAVLVRTEEVKKLLQDGVRL